MYTPTSDAVVGRVRNAEQVGGDRPAMTVPLGSDGRGGATGQRVIVVEPGVRIHVVSLRPWRATRGGLAFAARAQARHNTVRSMVSGGRRACGYVVQDRVTLHRTRALTESTRAEESVMRRRNRAPGSAAPQQRSGSREVKREQGAATCRVIAPDRTAWSPRNTRKASDSGRSGHTLGTSTSAQSGRAIRG